MSVQVAILMGSENDLPVMKEAAQILDEFAIKYEMRVLSAHRTPDETIDFVRKSTAAGVKTFIAGAGGAAHLAGVVAAVTHRPVIAVPIMNGAMNGVDALLAMVQMPKGVPVATVAIGGAANAGLLAAQIIGVSEAGVADKFKTYKETMKRKILDTKPISSK